MTWYSGAGLAGFVDTVGGVMRDVRRVRRGWHWDTPRPHSWPERGAVVPDRASDLGWARQEPVRTIRFLIQRGLLLPFTEAMAHPKVEGREWVRELERPVIFAANHSSHHLIFEPGQRGPFYRKLLRLSVTSVSVISVVHRDPPSRNVRTSTCPPSVSIVTSPSRSVR